jgi:hypothetical protein
VDAYTGQTCVAGDVHGVAEKLGQVVGVEQRASYSAVDFCQMASHRPAYGLAARATYGLRATARTKTTTSARCFHIAAMYRVQL